MLGFSPLICEWQSWAQGGYGMLILGAGLVFAVAVMVYMKWTGLIPYVVLGSLVMYYGVPILERMFDFNQSCVTVRAQFAQQEDYARATEVCESNLLNVETQNGEDCSCNGESATPQCESYRSVCSSQIGGAETANNYCTCMYADSLQNGDPQCTQIPAGARSAYTNSLSTQCSPAAAWGNVGYCKATGVPKEAQWIYPTSVGEGPANPHAYYTYQTVLDNPTGSPMTVTWYSESDDKEWLYDNNSQIFHSPGLTDWDTLYANTVTLQPGDNVLDVTVLNDNGSTYGSYENDQPNPTGTVDEVVSGSGQVISKTGGKSWYEVSGPPITPSPPPQGSITNCYTTSCTD